MMDLVTAELDRVHERIAGQFAQAEPRAYPRAYPAWTGAGRPIR